MKKISALFIILILILIACQPQSGIPPAPTYSTLVPPAGQTSSAPSLTPLPSQDLHIPAFITRPEGAVLRLMSYNVYWDSIFPVGDALNHAWRIADRSAAFRRILQAVRPDVVCLQEINPLRPPEQVAAIFDQVLPLADGGHWQAVSAKDDFIVSRFPLQRDGYQLPDRGHAAALVDLPQDVFGSSDLYIICSHFKSGGSQSDIARRQSQADSIIAHLRDALTPGERLDLPAATPFVLLGDFNIYDTDPAQHLTTLLTGDISNEDRFGSDFSPDWDGTALADALPRHNGSGELTYTWRNDLEPFNPGPLDRILYSDSVLDIANSFVLDTMLLSPADLDALSLQPGDVMLQPALGNYDHLPLVVDFVLVEG